MRSRFDEQLAQLHRELIEMGVLCEEVIALSSQALTEGSGALAEKVAPLDHDIDRKERDIENLCLRLLRRCQPVQETHVLRSGDLALDTREHTVTCGGQRVELTYKEYEVLRLFLSHPGTAFTRDRLMELVWGTDYCGESRTVDMHIRTLRQKLGDAGAHIQTIRNVGYRWEDKA